MSTEAASHRFLISLTPTEQRQLRREADKLGIKFASLARSIVIQYLHATRKGARK